MGKTFDDYLGSLPVEMQEPLQKSSHKILERCNFHPDTRKDDEQAQLIVGEVQSGKTASFTGVAALARDSGVPVVIVIAGTKKNLVNQTKQRLMQDLQIGQGAGLPQWEIVDRPTRRKASKYFETISKWDEENRPFEFKPTLLLIVLKSRAGLDHAADFLEEISTQMDLDSHPVLLIDDEADQAGLNNAVSRGQSSSVYSAILRLKSVIPWHSYCMYTATPQANFLIDIIDELSPTRVTLLDAGEQYLGGEKLFGEDIKFVIPIPDVELPVATDPNSNDSPPESLKRAIAFFLVALAVAQKRGSPKPLSMLIHPSGKQAHHQIYSKWTHEIVRSWQLLLQEKSDETYLETVKKVFVPALRELESSANFVSNPFQGGIEEIVNYITFLIPLVRIQVENGASTNKSIQPEDWGKAPGWVVIGGNKLDRGFTVEQLAVTYMPRTASLNADTLQQRGRFFGYKKSYVDLLRGWFSTASEEMFTDYVVHEKLMRSHLRELDESDADVKLWRRKFVLPNNLRPTRDQVIAILTNEWRLGQGFVFSQRRLYDSSVSIGFLDSYSLIEELHLGAEPVPDDQRRDKRNYYISCSAHHILTVLQDWVAHPEDRKILSELVSTLQHFDDNRELLAHVYFMDNLQVRERGSAWDNDPNLDQRDQRVGNLFAGKQHSGAMYPGDTAMKSTSGITIQIHRVHPRELPQGQDTLAIAVAGGSDLDFKVLEEILH
jgi:Z1 domain